MGRKNNALTLIRTIRTNLRGVRGFTLIELLIVVITIGLLAVLVISTLRGNILKANDAKRKADLDKIKIALEEYEKDRNCYPEEAEMQFCGGNSASSAIYPYLKNIPCDPVTGEPYYYEVPPGSTSCAEWFRLFTKLQNTHDKDYIIGIGKDSLYSYYTGSVNAPQPTPGSAPVSASPLPISTPAPAPAPTPSVKYWGCINGSCQAAPTDSNGQTLCSPVFDNPQCNGNPCSGQGAPECISTLVTPAPLQAPQPGASECGMCGGIDGVMCQSNLICLYGGTSSRATYPDQSGVCVKSDGSSSCDPRSRPPINPNQ